jgi:hypothetical protein
LMTQSGNVAGLPNTRIVSATTELNNITEDIRDAQSPPDELPPAVRDLPSVVIHTVGKILRWPKGGS